MRRIELVALLVVGCLIAAFPTVTAARQSCPGPFRVMPGFRGGSVCAQMGLSSRVGTCQRGQRFETLCDEAPGGRFRTCQGPRRCDGRGGAVHLPGNVGPGWGGPPPSRPGGWNWNNSRPMPPPGRPVPPLPPKRPGNWSCTSWDFNANRPCPPGWVNPNCRGGCEPARWR